MTKLTCEVVIHKYSDFYTQRWFLWYKVVISCKGSPKQPHFLCRSTKEKNTNIFEILRYPIAMQASNWILHKILHGTE